VTSAAGSVSQVREGALRLRSQRQVDQEEPVETAELV
jgi:hypothetical protein